jgi:Protein of unknown function (DUF1501)
MTGKHTMTKHTTCKQFRQVARRDFLRIGGLGLCGLGALDVFAAQQKAKAAAYEGVRLHEPKAKQMIVVWMAGGPPHTDMFDMKPDSPSDYKSRFNPISTNVDGLQICELMPKLAKMADKYCLIRSVTTMNKPGDHARAPMYWLTGNPRLPSGTDEYPMYGSVVSKVRPGPGDLPTFAVLGKIDHHINNSIANSFLGPAYAPFIFDPLQQKDDIAKMLQPQMELSEFQRDVDLLKAVDQGLRRQDSLDPLIAGLDKYQQTAFDMLRSPRLREALDLSKEKPETIERYTKNDPEKVNYTNDGNSKHFLLARRLIEAGVPVVHFSYGYWDWHGKNFSTGRRMMPKFDAALSSLIQDLDERGLLDSTIVLALGEMGRKPKCGDGDDPGRDHWDYAQFAVAAGGGFRGGTVVGTTDKLGEAVIDQFYKIESFGATLYHRMGIDPTSRLHTLNNRPISLIAEHAPIIKEALA